ncbi:MAG: excinuclease ABC subunit UvrC [Candidatus Eisenbacteria bacterium]|nr:excinuclease ABC subunit UvrC [Candidatus Eisenbacteria bacterium]
MAEQPQRADPPQDQSHRRAAPPTRPGVYLLKDASGRIIYVGKARNLRSRLRTYTGRSEPPDQKVEILRSRLRDVEFIVTESETEALILESNLIKEHRPRYNVRLKDDKRYPLIKVTTNEAYPRAYVTRIVRQDGARYFGPYTDAKAMRRTLRLIRQVFPVRQCPVFKLRPRPCLNYQIGRCLGPCRGVVDNEIYSAVVRDLCLFLEGRADDVVSTLTERMNAASKGLRFEEAAELRDRIRDVARTGRRQRVLTAADVDRDVVAVARHEGYAVASVVRIRGGKLVGCESLPLELGPRTGDDEIVETFLKQFYSLSSELPREILLDRDPPDRAAIEAWLTGRRGSRVSCSAPRRGDRKLLVGFATENARLALKRLFETRQAPPSVAELGVALGLKRPPRLISGVDVSNLSGSMTVGTVVSFRDGTPDRALYRKYRIRLVKGVDDYASIREVVSRHMRRVLREDGELPDLLLVDGGKGQLTAAWDGLNAAGARGVTVAALAKREEEVFVRGRSTPLSLDPDSLAKKLLVRVRNEVHRFSIAYHRSLRERAARHSLLDEVPGVGSTRKSALLERFGSVACLKERSVEEIAEVPGIGRETARKIREALDQIGSGGSRANRE